MYSKATFNCVSEKLNHMMIIFSEQFSKSLSIDVLYTMFCFVLYYLFTLSHTQKNRD